MSETNMPASEAGVEANERELASYELAFHVLPTVAEGEVATVFQVLKDIITKHGSEITIEEAPVRFELAYEIVKYLEGRNRKFNSAYFGWVRFKVEPAAIEAIKEDTEGVKELLRHLLIKLTKTEEENSFSFVEALANLDQKVQNIDLDEEVKEDSETEETEESDDSDKDDSKVEEDGEEAVDKV